MNTPRLQTMYSDMKRYEETDMVTVTTSLPLTTSQSPWVQFAITYANIHGYFSISVCVFVIISNILNIVVLTRKHMSSPTNFILTALAIAHMLTMSTYPIMACYLYIISQPDCDGTNHSKEWMYFILFHNLFIVTCHNIAMWLTVSLAVFRYIFVCKHHMAMVMCSLARGRVTVISIVGASILICLPNYLTYRVIDYGKSYNMPSCFWIVSSEIAVKYPAFEMFVFGLLGVVMKIVPCILLTVLSTLIIIAIHQAKKRRLRLMGMVNRVTDHDNASSDHNRTTMMLVVVVLTFVITELPQGILAMISAVNTNFFSRVYVNLGDLMDLLVLINSAGNFILYCIMSQQFRNTFKSLFLGKCFRPLFNKTPLQTEMS